MLRLRLRGFENGSARDISQAHLASEVRMLKLLLMFMSIGHPVFAEAGQAKASPVETIFDRLAGTWDWSGIKGKCRDNPFAISFTPDRQFLVLTYRQPFKPDAGLEVDPNRPTEVRYEVRGHTDKAIRVFMVQPQEKRRTDAGNLVIWDVILEGKNRFRWRRTDWPESGGTRVVQRCPAK
jgi:hypothetical protein